MISVTITEQDGGTARKGNYKWSVDVNGSSVAKGEVKGHQRAKGWKKLLKKVTNAVMKAPTVEPVQQELPAFTPDYA